MGDQYQICSTDSYTDYEVDTQVVNICDSDSDYVETGSDTEDRPPLKRARLNKNSQESTATSSSSQSSQSSATDDGAINNVSKERKKSKEKSKKSKDKDLIPSSFPLSS